MPNTGSGWEGNRQGGCQSGKAEPPLSVRALSHSSCCHLVVSVLGGQLRGCFSSPDIMHRNFQPGNKKYGSTPIRDFFRVSGGLHFVGTTGWRGRGQHSRGGPSPGMAGSGSSSWVQGCLGAREHVGGWKGQGSPGKVANEWGIREIVSGKRSDCLAALDHGGLEYCKPALCDLCAPLSWTLPGCPPPPWWWILFKYEELRGWDISSGGRVGGEGGGGVGAAVASPEGGGGLSIRCKGEGGCGLWGGRRLPLWFPWTPLADPPGRASSSPRALERSWRKGRTSWTVTLTAVKCSVHFSRQSPTAVSRRSGSSRPPRRGGVVWVSKSAVDPPECPNLVERMEGPDRDSARGGREDSDSYRGPRGNLVQRGGGGLRKSGPRTPVVCALRSVRSVDPARIVGLLGLCSKAR